MRAIICREWGGVDSLTISDIPSPKPGPSSLLIDVIATSANFADLVMIAGNYQTRPSFPFAPGLEAVGIISECGSEVKNFKPGDRVMALLDYGGFAEQVVAEADVCFLVPDNMNNCTAAAFLIAYASSHVALRWQAKLENQETLLVLGSAGGVGLTAIEIGKVIGARVIAGASSNEKLELAKNRGADYIVNYSEEDIKSEVMAFTNHNGVDVCFDPIGGDLFDSALSSVGWGGRYLHIGFAGGIPKIPANRLLVKHRSAMGSALRFFRHHRPELLQKTVYELIEWWQKGFLKLEIAGEWELKNAIQALEQLNDRTVKGKAIIKIKS